MSTAASRGVDVAGVSTIVQYDPPDEPAEYVHRVGRTARMGNSGLAVLFLLQSEEKYIELLKEKYNVTATEEKLPPLMRKLFPGKNSEDQAHHLALHFEHIVMDNDEIHDLARNGYNAFLRSYSIHSVETKKIFAIKSLHLGHVANSFALRESPKEIKEYFIKQRKAESLVKQKLKRKEEQAQKQGTAAFERRQLFSKATGESALASEFAAALTTKTAKKAKHSPMPGWKRKRAGGKGGKNKRQKQ